MNRKWVAMALALVMMLFGTVAFASSPSIMTSDLTSEGSTLDVAVVSAISEYIASTGGPAIDYFGDGVKGQVAKLLPADVSADDLVLYEAVAVNTATYTAAQLTSGIKIAVPSGFAKDAIVIILMGIPNGQGGVEGSPLGQLFLKGSFSLSFPAMWRQSLPLPRTRQLL